METHLFGSKYFLVPLFDISQSQVLKFQVVFQYAKNYIQVAQTVKFEYKYSSQVA